MNDLELKIYEIIKNQRKKREYFSSLTLENLLLDSIRFSEIIKYLYPDIDYKNVGREKIRKVKDSLLNLEKAKKIKVCFSELPFFILYEDSEKLNIRE